MAWPKGVPRKKRLIPGEVREAMRAEAAQQAASESTETVIERSAPIRSSEMRDNVRESAAPRRTRTRGKAYQDKFDFPVDLRKPGVSYQWITYEVLGQPQLNRVRSFERQGWEACLDEDIASFFMPPGHSGAIIVEGQMLVQRPEELTKEAEQEDYERAVSVIRAKEQQLSYTPPGTMTRDHATARPLIRKERGPVDIPR